MAINITTFKCSRCRQDGTVDNTGTYLKVFLTYTSTTSSSYIIRYTKDSVTNLVTFRSGTGTSINTSFVSPTAIMEADFSYSFLLGVTEGSIIRMKSDFIPIAFVLMDFNASGKGIAFGKVSTRANEMEINMPIFDRFGTQILNGSAYYEGGGAANPNTTKEELILTSTNTPIPGALFFVRTMFYSNKTTNRTQYAYPYNNATRSTYYRAFFSSAWSEWIEQPVIVSKGTIGIWEYRRYSDGTVECYGKINVSSVNVSGTLGNWYRSDALYSETAYPYPMNFTEAPATQMMFQTRNSSAALLWTFSNSAENARIYLPQCYLIRPVAGTGLNGNINIYAKGK